MTKMINTFAQGLDRDSSKNKYDNNHYYDARNLRPVTQEGLSGGAIENIKGTQYRLNVDPGSVGHRICGDVVLGEYLVLWTTTNTGSPNGSSTDSIWKVAIADLEALTGASVFTLNTNRFWSGGNLIYQGNMGLSTQNEIKAIARYENDDIQKVYWVDGYNRLRHINTVYNADTNDLVNMSLDKLETIGNIELTRPVPIDIGEGTLRAGRIQYAYQLYAVNGAETTFSPTSDLINLVNYSDTQPTSQDYRGSDIDVDTGKSVKCSIDIDTTGYTRMRIIAIHYTSLAGDPEIRIAEEREISGSAETVYFTDTGNSLGSYILEDIRTLGSILFSASEIETKDNILFPANITEEYFDVDYDARAYRFGGENSTNTNPNYNDNTYTSPATSGVRGIARVWQQDDSYYDITSTGAWTYSGGGSGSSWSLPNDIDAINKFNDLDNDGYHEHRLMYQADGIVPGGEGLNVSYEFKIKEIKIDDYTVTDQELYSVLDGTLDNPSYTDYASPYNAAKYVGYHRDEIYRFGIVFFDEKGRSSFVKWIGDIRMPSISTISNQVTYNAGGGSPTPQVGNIEITLAANTQYTLNIEQSTGGWKLYTFDNDPANGGPGFTATSDIANAMRNILETQETVASDASQTAPVSSAWNITWDGNYGAYGVDDFGSPYINYTQTQDYAAGLGAGSDFSIAYNDGSDIIGNVLYPEFNISNIPAGVTSYQIVRVKRESTDRTVRGQGILGPTDISGDIIHVNWDVSTGWEDIYTFACPEVAFNKNLSVHSNDRVQEVGEFFDHVTLSSTWGARTYKYNSVIALTNPQRPENAAGAGSAPGDEHDITSKTTLGAGAVVRQDQVESAIGDSTFLVNNSTNHTDKGISFVFEANNTNFRSKDTPYTATSPTDGRKLVNYRRNLFSTQYGGVTYNNRKQNYYIPVSDITIGAVSSLGVFGGDTYVGMFDYLYSSWEDGETTSTQPERIYFPCESSINLPLRLDSCYHRIYQYSNGALLHDHAGVWAGGVLSDFAQTNDLYRYNTVYSKENDTKIYLQAPFDWSSETDFPVRTYASEQKTINEYSDSWLNFKVNSYIDVDPQYGEITRLITLNDKLMFFQPKAFGILSVNERALLQTGDISQLSLGTSGILERYDNAKTGLGASKRKHVLLTPNALYWIDTLNKSMYKYTGGPEELSLMKGMDSYFRTALVNGDTTFLFHDPDYKEVYVNDYTDDWSLVYNELTDGFTGFNDFYPTYVINYDDKVLGTRNGYQFYKHNDNYADMGHLYGSYVDTSITLLVNPDNANTSIFNNIEWLTEMYDASGDEIDSTYENVRLWNDYQGDSISGITLIPGSNVKRRMRKWRYTIPRALYEPDGVTSKGRRDSRFRDTHLFVKLSYTNANDYRFIGHDIITSHVTSNK